MTEPRFFHSTLWPLSGASGGRTDSKLMLTPRLHTAIEPGKGHVTAQIDTALNLDISLGEEAPAWIELAWTNRERQLTAFTHMILTLRVSSEDTTELMPAIRLHGEDGFRDIFTASGLRPTPEIQSFESSITLPPEVVHAATRIDLMIFFAPTYARIHLHDFALTALQ